MNDDESKLWVIVGRAGNFGANMSSALVFPNMPRMECVMAFHSEADGWRWLLGDEPTPGNELAMRTAWKLVEVRCIESDERPCPECHQPAGYHKMDCTRRARP